MDQTETTNLKLQKGNFTQMPNEMLDYFADKQLSPTEYRVCFVLMRELVGWDYKFKPIELDVFVQKTGIAKTHISTALKSLVKEGILLKRKVPGYRTPCYGFNENSIGRVVISDHRKSFVAGSNVIDLNTFKLRKQESSDYENSELEVSKIRNQKRSEQATRAASQAPKYPPTHSNTLFRGDVKLDKNNWEQVREHLLKQFPNDEKRLDRTYKQICQRGYEKEGASAFHPNSVPAWLHSSYERIRREYAHLDGTQSKIG